MTRNARASHHQAILAMADKGSLECTSHKDLRSLQIIKIEEDTGKLDLEIVVNDDENAFRFKDQGKKPGYTTTCMVNSCQGRLLEFYSDKNDSIHQQALALEGYNVLMV